MPAHSATLLAPCTPPARPFCSWQARRPQGRAPRLRCSCHWQQQDDDWRQRAVAAAAALLLPAQGLAAPLEAAASSAAAVTAPLEQQQAQQQAARQLPSLDAVSSLPPLPTEFPPLPPLSLPKYKQVTLKNGLRVFMIEDKEIPVVRGSLLMRGGQRASPPDKVGLALET